MPEVRGSNPTLTKHYFLANFWFFCVSVGSNPSQNSHFSTFFNPLLIALRGPLWPSWTTLGGGEQRKAAEIGLKCKINSKNALLLHRKNEKFHFFKNPSFKFENLLVAYCPHVWVWKTSLRSLLNLFPYWSSLDEHCELTTLQSIELQRIAMRAWLAAV